ncbi:MAG: hypothetical protein IKA64_06510 [Clostridia bacterium]|nr:hypothetical protein [Clostridia bacterium]
MSDIKNTELGLTEEEIKMAKKKKWLAVWDKITTGLLIFLMSTPILILVYIFVWFYLNTQS